MVYDPFIVLLEEGVSYDQCVLLAELLLAFALLHSVHQGQIFTNSYEKRSERQMRKERYIYLNSEFQRIARRDKKAFLNDQ